MLLAIMNNDTGNYLAWNAEMKVAMKDNEYWWKPVSVKDQFGFQVPEKEAAAASADARSFYTLQLEADETVILKKQKGSLNSAQLWSLRVPKSAI